MLCLTVLGLQRFASLVFIFALGCDVSGNKCGVLNPCFVLTFFREMYSMTHVFIEVAAYLCGLMQRDQHAVLSSNPVEGIGFTPRLKKQTGLC